MRIDPARTLLPGGLAFLALCALGAACPDKKDPPPAGASAGSSSSSASSSSASSSSASSTGIDDTRDQADPGAASGDSVGDPGEAPAPAFADKPAGPRVTVLYTASVQGYVAPCGCTAEPLGGVARLSAAVDQANEKHHGQVLFVDAGDLLFEKIDDDEPADECQADARHELLLSTYARKGLAATTLGPLDDVRGPEWRDSRLAKHGVLTLGANLSREVSSPSAAFRVEEVEAGDDKVKVGLTGFRALEAGDVEAAARALAQALKDMKPALGEGPALTVALAQAPRPLARQVLGDAAVKKLVEEGGPRLDVVILGREPGETPVAPERVGQGGPVMVASGMQAQHLGVLEVELAGRTAGQPLALDDRLAAAERRAKLLDTRIEQYEERVAEQEAGPRQRFIQKKLDAAKEERASLHAAALKEPPPKAAYLTARAVALTRGRPEEDKAAQALAAYEERIPALVKRCEANITCPEPGPDQPTYVGVETCYGCHQEAVKFWRQQRVELPFTDEQGRQQVREVGHSKAWKTLVDEGKTEDRSCVGCHSIGFMEPGGYCKVSEVDFRVDVQCEACHGPGSAHVQNAGDPAALVEQDVNEAVCRRCHHVPHIPTTESFVFEDKLQHILGPGHGEVRAQELGAR